MRTFAFAVMFVALGRVVFADEMPTRPGEVKLTDSAAKDATLPGHEVSTCMAALGVDYPVLLQKARGGDEAALRLFVWLGHYASPDGGAAEGYADALDGLIKTVGDEKFVAAVSGQEYEVLAACYGFLCFLMEAESPDPEKPAATIAAKLPKTMAAIRSGTKSKPLWK